MVDAEEQQFEAEFANWVRRHSAPAIELKRQFPDGPAGRSFLGGVPTLPDGMKWLRDADGVPMTFLGQIDLSTLPQPLDSPLPRDGVLFFFFDALKGNDYGGGSTQVLYAPESRAVPDRETPVAEGLPRFGQVSDPRHVGGGYTFNHNVDFGPG